MPLLVSPGTRQYHTFLTFPFQHRLRFILKERLSAPYSTVTDFARLRGWSTSVPFSTAV